VRNVLQLLWQEDPMAIRLTREEFHRWAEGQTQRYERIAGEPVAMLPERVQHVRIKSRVWAALDRAIRDGGLDCEALADGLTIEVDEDTEYEPDAVVNYGPRLPPDATAATNPVIVVEVLSPSTQSVDSGEKLADYFRVPSIEHYLVVRSRRQENHPPLAWGGRVRFAGGQCRCHSARSTGNRFGCGGGLWRAGSITASDPV
jgi:Uma2 family endonuclease